MRQTQTTVTYQGQYTIIRRTSDGATVKLWNIGRCWSMHSSLLDSFAEIAGRPNDEDSIVRRIRRSLRDGEPW